MASEKKYSTTNYWRYIFTPFLLGVLILGLFLLFTSSDAQVGDFGSVIKRTNALLANTGNPTNLRV